MVATDDDRGADLAGCDQPVELQAGLRPLAVAEPADPGRQALEGDLLLRHPEPALEPGVIGEELHQGAVGAQDVGRIAAQGDPAEGPVALAEEGPDERRHEPGVGEGILDAGLLGHRPEVVAIVEDDGAGALELEHRPDVGGHRAHRALDVEVRLGGAQGDRVVQADLGRDVAAERVVGRGLVGDDVEALAGLRPGRLDLGGVADQGDRQGKTLGGRPASPGQGLGRIGREPVHVADLVPPPSSALVDLDADRRPVVHRHGQRLGAAHPAEPGGQGHRPAERAAEVLAGELAERLVRPLEDPLGPDVDPGAGGHLAVHHQAGGLELPEVLPGGPLPDQVRVGDEDPGRPGMGPEDADRLAALDQERLVVGQPAKLADDRVERLPRPGCATGPAVDHERVGVLGDLRIEVVHEHPQDGFLLPAAARDDGPARGANGSSAGQGVAGGSGHGPSLAPPARPGSAAGDRHLRPGPAPVAGHQQLGPADARVADRLADRHPDLVGREGRDRRRRTPAGRGRPARSCRRRTSRRSPSRPRTGSRRRR